MSGCGVWTLFSKQREPCWFWGRRGKLGKPRFRKVKYGSGSRREMQRGGRDGPGAAASGTERKRHIRDILERDDRTG